MSLYSVKVSLKLRAGVAQRPIFAELTNNLAERTVKPFVMARKNFLFCDTAKGADASALCFSVIETAKRNGLDPFGYLLFLLQELPKLGENPSEEQLVPLLPWAESLPEYCKIK